MTPRMFYDADCPLDPLKAKTVVFIGYGNQGRAQALNLRDSTSQSLSPAPRIIVANDKDSYGGQAEQDGFELTDDWASAAKEADILFLLVPDQIQPKLFNERIAPTLKKSACIVVASGYNVFYKHLKVSDTNDIVMVAPRMIGTSVRSRYLSGAGYPCFVSAEQDGTGQAWPIALAICRAIGATKKGVTESSVREETLIDLFAEQAIWPRIIATFTEGYSLLKSLGCSDEALVHDMYLSKEPAEIFEKCADEGFIKQLVLHSSVSQYGQLKGYMELDTTDMKKDFERVAKDRILSGEFAKEFMAIDSEGPGTQAKLKELYGLAEQSELAKGDAKVRERLKLNTATNV